jgi:uncharacterized protein involved in type VI secretion and phage assembly
MSNISSLNLSITGFSGKLAVLSFDLLEGIFGDDYLIVSFLAASGCSESMLGQKASFSFEYENKKEFFNGTVAECSEEQSGTGFSRITLQAKTLRHNADKEKNCAVYCETDAETIIRSLLKKNGILAKCELNSFYEMNFKIQYNESDLAFLQRLMENLSIIEFAKHSEGSSELIVSDGDVFEEQKTSFAKCRLEAKESGNFFFGFGHSPLRPGTVFEAFGETFIACSAFHSGSQEAAFGLKNKTDGYTCQVAAFSKRMSHKLPSSKAKPQVPGVIVAKIEGFKGSFASLDGQGRYTVRMPFDEENHNGTLASYPIHLAQNFAGEDCGVHFPLKKDTPVLIAFENGDIDCPIALGALPKETCKSPVAKTNSHQNILKTSSGIKFLLDDSNGGLDIEAPANITIKAGGKLILKGSMVEIN